MESSKLQRAATSTSILYLPSLGPPGHGHGDERIHGEDPLHISSYYNSVSLPHRIASDKLYLHVPALYLYLEASSTPDI